MATSPPIKVRYSSVDGYRHLATYKTLARAQDFASRWVGETPDISYTFGYAVSPSGVGKVEAVSGCSIWDLFPKVEKPGSDLRVDG